MLLLKCFFSYDSLRFFILITINLFLFLLSLIYFYILIFRLNTRPRCRSGDQSIRSYRNGLYIDAEKRPEYNYADGGNVVSEIG